MPANGLGIKNVRDFRATFLSAVTELKVVKKCHKTTTTRIFFDAVLPPVLL